MGITSYSTRFNSEDKVRNAELAAEDLRKQAAGLKPAQVIFFASIDYDPVRIAAAMRDAFPGAVTLGCSTSGELIDGKLIGGSVVAMLFDADAFDFFDVDVLHRLDASGQRNDPRKLVSDAFAKFGEKLGRPVGALEHDKYVGLAFADGRHYFSEPVLEAVGDMTDVPFVGGMSGDDGKFAYTPLFCNGEMHVDVIILALAKPKGKFRLVKTMGLDILERTLVVTGADEENRLLTHFDGVPAAKAYRESMAEIAGDALVEPEAEMTFAGTFSKWPLALMVGDEPYLRVAMEVKPDGSLVVLNAVKEGMRFKQSRMADIVDTTAADMKKVREDLGSISAILHINCISRHGKILEEGKVEEFAKLFAGYPSVGFSSHGEIYIAIANQTSTMLVFG